MRIPSPLRAPQAVELKGESAVQYCSRRWDKTDNNNNTHTYRITVCSATATLSVEAVVRGHEHCSYASSECEILRDELVHEYDTRITGIKSSFR